MNVYLNMGVFVLCILLLVISIRKLNDKAPVTPTIAKPIPKKEVWLNVSFDVSNGPILIIKGVRVSDSSSNTHTQFPQSELVVDLFSVKGETLEEANKQMEEIIRTSPYMGWARTWYCPDKNRQETLSELKKLYAKIDKIRDFEKSLDVLES